MLQKKNLLMPLFISDFSCKLQTAVWVLKSYLCMLAILFCVALMNHTLGPLTPHFLIVVDVQIILRTSASFYAYFKPSHHKTEALKFEHKKNLARSSYRPT